MMNVVVALFLVLSSLVVTAVPEAPTQGAIVVEHSTHKLKQVLDKARDVKEHAQEAVSEALSKAKDFVPSKTSEVSNKAKGVISAACRISYDFSRTAAAKVSSAVTEKVVPTVNPYVPDERGQAKIGRFAASFVKNAAFYGLPVVFKYWVPGGVPLYNIALRSLRDVETEDYKQVKTKTEHCDEELKKLKAKVNKLERKLSGGGGENIQDDVKFKRESSVGLTEHSERIWSNNRKLRMFRRDPRREEEQKGESWKSSPDQGYVGPDDQGWITI